MYVINKATTGIPEIDKGLGVYFGYLAHVNVLPEGTYVLAGGSIRALFDKTAVKDLDIYILGDQYHHAKILDEVSNTCPEAFPIIKFCNPFAYFKLINITKELITPANRNAKTAKPIITDEDNDAFWIGQNEIANIWPDYVVNDNPFSAPIQLLSFHYDSHYYEREPSAVGIHERFANTSVTTLTEVVESFDLTIAKGAVEFLVTDKCIIVSAISIPQDCLIDICMRKLRLSVPGHIVPQQLCTIKRFHKYTKIGYDVDEAFYSEWRDKFKYNPHVLELSYD